MGTCYTKKTKIQSRRIQENISLKENGVLTSPALLNKAWPKGITAVNHAVINLLEAAFYKLLVQSTSAVLKQ